MKERPILFSGPMVRALLDGRKTQTRRIVKPQPRQHQGYPEPYAENGGGAHRWNWYYDDCTQKHSPLYDADKDCGQYVDCPYGQPGDRLWVREAWRKDYASDGHDEDDYIVFYRADPDRFSTQVISRLAAKWKPSIHMLRRDSRITLEVESVRVERLQKISAADAEAEGVFRHVAEHSINKVFRDTRCETALRYYRELWEKINGPGSWDANPFVWVVSFRRIE